MSYNRFIEDVKNHTRTSKAERIFCNSLFDDRGLLGNELLNKSNSEKDLVRVLYVIIDSFILHSQFGKIWHTLVLN